MATSGSAEFCLSVWGQPRGGQNISGGTFHGPVAAVMKDCASIINSHPPGQRKELLETLQKLLNGENYELKRSRD